MLSRDQANRLQGDAVHGPGGERIGSVGRIFLDDATGEPEWVTVRTPGRAAESFVPLEAAEPHPGGLLVPYDGATVAGAPTVGAAGGHLSGQDEEALHLYYRGTVAGRAAGSPGDGAMTRSEERLRVGRRTVVAGRARLRKVVVTETVQVEVPLRREEVRLEWEPAGDLDAVEVDVPLGDRLAERERELVLFAERPVVTTDTVPVERVRLRIETVTGTETVAGQVRKEQIQLDQTQTRPPA